MINYVVHDKYYSETSGQKCVGIRVDTGVPYSTFMNPKDFNEKPGVYWIQGSGGHYSEWDGIKFDDNTEDAKKATNDYYRNWHSCTQYCSTGGKLETWKPYGPTPTGNPFGASSYLKPLEFNNDFFGPTGYQPDLAYIYLGLGIPYSGGRK